MSRLYVSAEGDVAKTGVTRAGHHEVQAHVRGWNLGILARATVNREGQTVVTAYLTGGSNDHSQKIWLGTWTESDLRLKASVEQVET